MTQLTALKELAENVSVDLATFDWTSPGWPFGFPAATAESAYNGSLDAAKALHEAVLGDVWSLNYMIQNRYPDNGQKPDGSWTVGLHGVFPTRYDHVEVKSSSPARAWLLDIIRAKIAELESES